MHSGMRRKDREIKDQAEIIRILEEGFDCHLAMCRDNKPYVIPMIYVYNDGFMYFHCAEVGLKLDILRENNEVCFEVQISNNTIVENTELPCDWGFSYKSVIGFGKAAFIEDSNKKRKVYDLLVSKMAPPHYVHGEDPYVEKKIKGTHIIQVKIESMTGKKWDGIKKIVK